MLASRARARHRADLDNAWIDLVNTLDCHLGPTGPRNAHELTLAHAHSLSPVERLQLREGQHYITGLFNHFHGPT